MLQTGFLGPGHSHRIRLHSADGVEAGGLAIRDVISPSDLPVRASDTLTARLSPTAFRLELMRQARLVSMWKF